MIFFVSASWIWIAVFSTTENYVTGACAGSRQFTANLYPGRPVHEMDVNKCKVRFRRAHLLTGLTATHGNPCHLVPRHLDFALQLQGEQHFIFNDHNFQWGSSS